MSTNQPLSVRGALEATSSTIVGFFTLVLGVWLIFMTGYLVAALAVVIAGAIAFPPTRGIVTLGRLRVGRWLHDAIAFFSWFVWLTIAYFIAQPWA